ncbi:MAG: DUF4835 family protein [Bacteroidota bacterium]
MLKKLFSVIGFCCMTSVLGYAQELSCKVKILHEKITGVDQQVFTAMERGLTEFLNARKWGTDEFDATERIEVNILINIISKFGASDPDGYNATMSIQASRPVYNSSYSSPLINYLDRDFAFHFSQYTQLSFDDNRVSGTNPLESNLTAVMAYYAYLILGYDYDSFAPSGGTAFFKKAQNVVNNAPEQGKDIVGWKAVEGNRNRFWLIDQILSPRFIDMRGFWYSMHREGLDLMYTKPIESRQKILSGIPKLSQVQKDNPSAFIIQFFFNTKSDELTHILAQAPKEDKQKYVPMLSAMDVPNASKYNALLK